MANIMTFPETFEEFAEQYKIIDDEEVYTNGSELIPIFRVKQWLEHEDLVKKMEKKNKEQTNSTKKECILRAIFLFFS